MKIIGNPRRGVLVLTGAGFLAAGVGPCLQRAALAQEVEPETYADAVSYRFLGPEGNRASAVAGEPGDPMVAYIGAASGGVWRTTDGGTNWEPVFDEQPAQSIGALAVSRSAPNEVWAGTGEAFYIRLSTAHGNGVYKSTDRGESWTHVGLERTGRISDLVIHPRDPDVAYVCATGHAFAPQPERGVFRTVDGGESWRKVLFVDENTGCSDLAVDPRDPATLFAGMWQLEVDPWGLHSGGPGSGVYVTRDGGETWTELAGDGLPAADATVGKVAVAVAPSRPARIYALLQQEDPVLYRSDDGGESWREVSRNHSVAERGPYYTRLAVSPSDPDRVYFASVRWEVSRDGGATLMDDPGRAGGDNHDVWIDPTNANRIMVAHDGGAGITLDGGESYEQVVLPIAQMYHVHVDDDVPYHVYGNRQDGYSYMAPSNTLSFGIPPGAWHSVGGCESGFAVPDTVSDRWVWSGCYDGGLERYDRRTGHARDVRVWPEAGYGVPPAAKRYRWNWTFPIEISPHDPGRVYVGSQHVHVTRNGGQSWEVVSPDLTRNVEARQVSSGGVATDNLNTFSANTLSAITESPVEEGVLWAGTYDGLVHVSRNGGGAWTDVTAHVPGLPAWGRVSNIAPSHFEAGTAYLAVNLMEQGDFAPYVYRTRDYGESWERIDGDLPRSVFSPVHVVKEDPVRAGMLYAGTENGVWFSLDDGAHWMPLQGDLPHAPVYWLAIQPQFHDLVVATYGRGIWILDDVTALRRMDAESLGAPAHLFEPRRAYRFAGRHNIASVPGHVFGRNPRPGASLHYHLAQAVEDGARLVVTDAAGDTVRTLEAAGESGLHRVWWDLRHEDPVEPRLRTRPPGRDWVPLGEDGWRPLVPWDLDLSQRGPRAAPGTYRVTLVAGDTAIARSLTVAKDPSTEGSAEDVRAQVELALRIRDDLSATARLVNRLEWLRRQLAELRELLGEAVAGGTGGAPAALDSATAAGLREGARELEGAAVDVEARLFDVHLTGAREDAFRNPNRLYSRFSALLSDVAEDAADHPPTDQQREVFDLLHGRLEEARTAYGELVEQRVPEMRERLRAAAIPFALSAGPPRR